MALNFNFGGSLGWMPEMWADYTYVQVTNDIIQSVSFNYRFDSRTSGRPLVTGCYLICVEWSAVLNYSAINKKKHIGSFIRR